MRSFDHGSYRTGSGLCRHEKQNQAAPSSLLRCSLVPPPCLESQVAQNNRLRYPKATQNVSKVAQNCKKVDFVSQHNRLLYPKIAHNSSAEPIIMDPPWAAKIVLALVIEPSPTPSHTAPSPKQGPSKA